jgi:hypothetical protein
VSPLDRANCLAAFMANINAPEVNVIAQAIEAAVAEEREACAAMVGTSEAPRHVVAARIRARGAR